MKTDDLIIQLVASAGPVRPLQRLWVRLSRWSAASVLLAAAGVLLIGVRPDFSSVIQDPAFVASSILLVTTGVLAAAAALMLSVPGAGRSPVHRAVPILLALAWVGVLVVELIRSGGGAEQLVAAAFHGACPLLIAALSGGPAWMLFRMVRAAAPLSPAWTAGLAALAAAAWGAAAMQVACPYDSPAHQLREHALIVLILALFGAALGSRWLVWGRAALPVWPRHL